MGHLQGSIPLALVPAEGDSYAGGQEVVECRDLAHVHKELEEDGPEERRGDEHSNPLLWTQLPQHPVQGRHSVNERVRDLNAQ